jgi:hypothetical protein
MTASNDYYLDENILDDIKTAIKRRREKAAIKRRKVQYELGKPHRNTERIPVRAYSEEFCDILLSYLLDEGYANNLDSAEKIMVNMSEDWAYSIVEAIDWTESEPGITSGPIPIKRLTGSRASAARRHEFEKKRRKTSGKYVSGRDPQGGLSRLMLAFKQRAAETGQG